MEALSMTTADSVMAVVNALGVSVLPIWGVTEQGHCACPKGSECKDPGKHPLGKLVPNGVKNSSKDETIIRAWDRQYPHANWAMRCGEPLLDGGFLGVFDWDPRNGAVESMADCGVFPPTVTATTGGAGGHRLYRFSKSPDSCSLGPGLDFQGAGKYVVIAPSKHRSGGYYAWDLGAHPGETTIANAPAWLENRVHEAMPRPAHDGVGTAKETVLGEAFVLAGRSGPVMPDGTMFVNCPQSDQHSDARGRGEDASAVALPPAGGSLAGGFKCQHGHCANLKWHDVAKLLGKDVMDAAHKKYPRLSAVPKNHVEPVPKSILEAEHEDKTLEMKRFYKRLHFAESAAGGKSKIIPDVVNISTILMHDPRWKGILQWDEFSQVLRFTAPPPWFDDDAPSKGAGNIWKDEDETRLVLWMQRQYGIKMKGGDLRDIAYVVALRNTYNPLKDYLNALVWDGTNRLDGWLGQYAGADDTAYTRTAGRKWAIAAVARALDPGCKVDTLLVLEGPQGKGKSTLLRSLCANPDWFSDTPFDIGSKDAYIALNGKWIVELAELASLKKADLDRAKAFFSSPVDNYRPPFGKVRVAVPRTSLFAGTVNLGQYLHDPTGARRFVPVRVGTIDLEGVIADRDQLWAEAVNIYKLWSGRGSPQSEALWWPGLDEMDLFEAEQSKRQVAGIEDPWVAGITQFAGGARCLSIIEHRGAVLIHEFAEALGIDKKDLDSGKTTRIGIIIATNLGWKRVQVAIHGVKITAYRP